MTASYGRTDRAGSGGSGRPPLSLTCDSGIGDLKEAKLPLNELAEVLHQMKAVGDLPRLSRLDARPQHRDQHDRG